MTHARKQVQSFVLQCYLKKEYIEKGGTHMQAKKIKPAKGQQFIHVFLTNY